MTHNTELVLFRVKNVGHEALSVCTVNYTKSV